MKIPTVSDLLYSVHHDRHAFAKRAARRRKIAIGISLAVGCAALALRACAFGQDAVSSTLFPSQIRPIVHDMGDPLPTLAPLTVADLFAKLCAEEAIPEWSEPVAAKVTPTPKPTATVVRRAIRVYDDHIEKITPLRP